MPLTGIADEEELKLLRLVIDGQIQNLAGPRHEVPFAVNRWKCGIIWRIVVAQQARTIKQHIYRMFDSVVHGIGQHHKLLMKLPAI